MPVLRRQSVTPAECVQRVETIRESFDAVVGRTSGFFPRIRSMHPTHDVLRKNALIKTPVRSLIRLGSSTNDNEALSNLTPAQRAKVVLINTPEAIAISSNKLKMKGAFLRAGIKSPEYIQITINSGHITLNERELQPDGRVEVHMISLPNLSTIALMEAFGVTQESKFPKFVAKISNGSRGEGMMFLDTIQKFHDFLHAKLDGEYPTHYLELFYEYGREYRLHVNKNGCFYTCRKLLKNDTPEEQRYYKNDSNSIWVVDSNPSFKRPGNWNDIEAECVKALKAVGLDFAAFDVLVKSKTSDQDSNAALDFMIIECNSAPSFGDVTATKYIEMLPQLIMEKAREMEII